LRSACDALHGWHSAKDPDHGKQVIFATATAVGLAFQRRLTFEEKVPVERGLTLERA
jgi:hypothetical protein